MARLIPPIDPTEIEKLPERTVGIALCEQLPENVRIFHSYVWLREGLEGATAKKRIVLREGEVDFVILDPRYGFMAVEVKGGELEFLPIEGYWRRIGGNHDPKDPFEQVARNFRAIEKRLKTNEFKGQESLPFSRARCVIFPDHDYDGSLPPGADRNILFGASDLPRLGKRIEALFKMQPFVPPNRLDKDILDKLSRGLTSNFRLVPALWREIEEQERKFIRFTDDQLRLLEFLSNRNRAAIEGVAGSGKTMLAIAKARAFADEGKSVLFVCYNVLLAEWLRSNLPPEYREHLKIQHYHSLCAEWVKRAGIRWHPGEDETTFFREEAPALLEQAIDLLPEDLFDAVVVDEGQDFEDTWWDTIEMLNKNLTEGDLYVFYDPDQLIFSSKMAPLPALGGPFPLPVNCRNTTSITEHCSGILGKTLKVRPETPSGRKPVVIRAAKGEEQQKQVQEQIFEWTKKPASLNYSQIAIITTPAVGSSSLARVKRFGKIPVVSSLESWRQGEGVLVASLYRFKGLEADAIILTDFTKPDPNAHEWGFSPEHYYVACSRAKHLLTILEL